MGPLVGQTVTRVCVCVQRARLRISLQNMCGLKKKLLLLVAAVWVAKKKRQKSYLQAQVWRALVWVCPAF